MAVGTPDQMTATKHIVVILAALSLVLLSFVDACAESWTSRPMKDVQAELATLLGCEWMGSNYPIVCYAKSLEVTFVVTRDEFDGTIAQMKTGAVIVSCPRDRQREKRSYGATAKLLKYLFPEWKDSSAWLTRALRRVRASYDDKPTSITVDGATVQVRWLETMQCNTYAALTVTKNVPREGKP